MPYGFACALHKDGINLLASSCLVVRGGKCKLLIGIFRFLLSDLGVSAIDFMLSSLNCAIKAAVNRITSEPFGKWMATSVEVLGATRLGSAFAAIVGPSCKFYL